LKTKVNDNKEAGFISEAKDFAVFSRKKDKNRKLFHEKCNNAAKRFLDLLTYLAQKGEIKNET
jgi:hypothetical protein